MRANLESTGGIAFSQSVLLALVDAGMARDDAYAVVQRAAAAAWDEGASFQRTRWRPIAGAGACPTAALEALFDPRRFLREPRRGVRAAREAPGGGGVSADAVLHARGKVRDVYEAGDDRLLIVATDRISAFDVVLPTPIPDKGRVLTGPVAASGSSARATSSATI